LFDPGGAFFRPDPHTEAAGARSGGHRTAFGRPQGIVLDGSEHDGKLVCVGTLTSFRHKVGCKRTPHERRWL